jgi:hypothetical protein
MTSKQMSLQRFRRLLIILFVLMGLTGIGMLNGFFQLGELSQTRFAIIDQCETDYGRVGTDRDKCIDREVEGIDGEASKLYTLIALPGIAFASLSLWVVMVVVGRRPTNSGEGDNQ